ncbi:hypothetical protein [Pseudoalteromonas umbrosa]|uniref:hypothetical protein n=1 Tax=Pseudoalteromonas umbrosa TaxID=3048489 RepID=UPI0024C3F453|nr:hypothetical protein [Pseudoalteromonas sp. B95]MDK1290177.1 hypothetical protein [Pseudoalteromonas sp. B95]
MAFSMKSVLAETFVNATSSSVNTHGLHSVTFTLENALASGDFLLQAIRQHASDNAITLKEDISNSYLSVYLVPNRNATANGVDKNKFDNGDYDDTLVARRIPLSKLIQSQSGSTLYAAFEISGLPAGIDYKYAFELVLNKQPQTDWLTSSDIIALEGTEIGKPSVTIKKVEEGSAVKVTIDTAVTDDTDTFVLEVIDSTKAKMPEMSYDETVILTSNFTFDPDAKPVFTFSPTTENMRRYVNYEIRVRARKAEAGKADSASEYEVVTAEPFMLPWLSDFVDQTVIQGRQVEDTLVADLAQNILDNAQVRDQLRGALNSGSYSSVASLLYDMTRDVAVEEFQTMAIKFSQIREFLRRIALYSEIDESYAEMLDLSDPELKEAFTFVTKQGYREGIPTSYYTWLDKAFYLGAVVDTQTNKIAENKFHVTVRGSVYRDRAEILFS